MPKQKPKKKKNRALVLTKPQPPAEQLTAESLEASFVTTGKKVELFERFIKANLKEGVDYGAATDYAGAKPTLLKPGSEKLCLLLNARPEFARDNETLEHLAPAIREETVALLCRLVSRTDATILGEGRGTSSVWKLSNQKKILDVNRAVKMAEKRAQMDAVLRVAALSSRFTQDLEDPEYKDTKEHQPQETTLRPSAAPRPAGYDANTDRGFPSTTAQQNCIARHWAELMRLYGINETAVTDNHAVRFMEQKFNKTKLEELSKKQASFMIDEIQRLKRDHKPKPEIKTDAIIMTETDMKECETKMRGMKTAAALDNYIDDVRAWPKTPKQQAALNNIYMECRKAVI